MPAIVFAIGVLTMAIAAVKAIRLASIFLLPSRLGRYAHSSPDGRPAWALVTGASDGIGQELARELAARGFNVVLHGRNQAKLSQVLARLESLHPERSFRLLVADASRVPCKGCLEGAGQQQQLDDDRVLDFSAISAAVADLPLTVLINNAGGGPVNPTYAPLADCSAARVTDNVSLNALFPLHLTRALLPQLRRNAPALVMNIGSLADMGFPLLVSYGASKRFLMTITRALILEMALRGDDVELLGIRVGKVTGAAGFYDKPSLFMPAAETIARAALARAGHGHGVVAGYWAHALEHLLVRLLPAWIRDRVVVAAIRRELETKRA